MMGKIVGCNDREAVGSVVGVTLGVVVGKRLGTDEGIG
jgi:hypothetical protein